MGGGGKAAFFQIDHYKNKERTKIKNNMHKQNMRLDKLMGWNWNLFDLEE